MGLPLESALLTGFRAGPPCLTANGGRLFQSTRSYNATLRNRVHGPPGPERAGSRHDRALPRFHRGSGWQDPPPRGLGTPPARLSHQQAAQGPLRAHEHRVRWQDAQRAGDRLPLQRCGAASSHHPPRRGHHRALAAGQDR